jgi:hypothetical protein
MCGRSGSSCRALAMHKNTTSPLSAPPWSGLPTVRRALITARRAAVLHASPCLTACCQRRAEQTDLRRLLLATWLVGRSRSRPSWRPIPACAGCCSTFPTSSPTPPKALAERGVDDRVDCVAGDFSHRCPSAATATCCPSCCTTGPTRRPGASCATSPPPAAAAHGADHRVRGTTRRYPAPVQDDRPDDARCGGRQPTHRTRVAELLTAAGFTGIAVRHTGAPYSVIHAAAP